MSLLVRYTLASPDSHDNQTQAMEELVARLKTLGVTELDVSVANPGLSPAEQLAGLERRFTGHEDDDLMMELKELVRAQIVG